MNLVKLYTCHGPMFVDCSQLLNPNRIHLTIYTSRGNRVSEVGKTKRVRENASFGVHRENLFATLDMAIANRERIYADMFARSN